MHIWESSGFGRGTMQRKESGSLWDMLTCLDTYNEHFDVYWIWICSLMYLDMLNYALGYATMQYPNA